MPTPDQITRSLIAIANELTPLALGWHVVAVIALLLAAVGWRPDKRTAATLLVLPAWSVAIVAWYYANPFNGVMFVALALTLSGVAATLPRHRVNPGGRGARIAGGALIAFGMVYPHFLVSGSVLAYAYASPLGLVPCPTLSFMAGLSLMANGFESRTWTICLVAAAALYGAIGIGVLSVWIDVALLAGALALTVQARRLRPGTFPSRMRDFSHAS